MVSAHFAGRRKYAGVAGLERLRRRDYAVFYAFNQVFLFLILLVQLAYGFFAFSFRLLGRFCIPLPLFCGFFRPFLFFSFYLGFFLGLVDLFLRLVKFFFLRLLFGFGVCFAHNIFGELVVPVAFRHSRNRIFQHLAELAESCDDVRQKTGYFA